MTESPRRLSTGRSASAGQRSYKQRGERFIALDDETCAVLDDWIADQRPDVEDEDGRKRVDRQSEQPADAIHFGSEIHDVLGGGIAVDAKVVQDDVFPASETVT